MIEFNLEAKEEQKRMMLEREMLQKASAAAWAEFKYPKPKFTTVIPLSPDALTAVYKYYQYIDDFTV